jgi:hypothetical protein
MSEDYLWDRSGPADPEIERLERTLAPLRYRHRPELTGRRKPAPRLAWAAAAAVVLGAVCISQFRTPPAPETAWNIDGAAVHAGQVVQTNSGSNLRLEANTIGRIDLFPNSELRASGDKRLQLTRGSLHAFIWAPARQFVVDTPSARAVDLGCEYTISVDPSGDGLLKVSLGWVAFQHNDHEAFIPEGAECATTRRRGPGIPYYQDAPSELRMSLTRFERDGSGLESLLASARPKDALTVWHLLTRVPANDRARVFDRFAQLVEIPREVSRDAILRRDPLALDLCWNALNLENTGWWRGWERRWTE